MIVLEVYFKTISIINNYINFSFAPLAKNKFIVFNCSLISEKSYQFLYYRMLVLIKLALFPFGLL